MLVKNNPVTGCHEWQGRKDRDGYGFLHVLGVPFRVHRLAYMLFVGEIPEGQFVLHSCDNPCCFNPDHLRVGDNRDNYEDQVARGRQQNGPNATGAFVGRGKSKKLKPGEFAQKRAEDRATRTKNWKPPHPGWQPRRRKLDESKVAEILASAEEGIVLAVQYQVSSAMISRIRRGHLWKHVSMESKIG